MGHGAATNTYSRNFKRQFLLGFNNYLRSALTLKWGELSSRQLGKRTACRDVAPLKPCMSAIERGGRTRLSSALITRMSMSRGRSAPHPIDDRAAAGCALGEMIRLSVSADDRGRCQV